MAGSHYNLQSKPGALLEASRNPKMKRAVMKAIGMPMKPKKRKATFAPKIGGTQPNPGRITQDTSTPMMSPGKGYMPTGRLDAGGVPMKKRSTKRKGSMSLVKSPSANRTQTKRRKGTMGMISSPKMTSNLRTKKGVSGRSFGDEKLQALSTEHSDESKNDFRKASKRRKGAASVKMPMPPKMTGMPKVNMPKMKRKSAHSYKNLGAFAHKRKVAKKKSA